MLTRRRGGNHSIFHPPQPYRFDPCTRQQHAYATTRTTHTYATGNILVAREYMREHADADAGPWRKHLVDIGNTILGEFTLRGIVFA